MSAPTRVPGKLGWVQAPPDERTMRLTPYLAADFPAPPASANWLSKVRSWPLYGNDTIGDCEPVSCAHLTQAWTAYAGREVRIREADVIAAYSRISGYDPATGANDVGCTSLDTLNFWRGTGIGGRKITAYVQLDHTDLDQVRAAISTFGGIIVAALMPRAASEQTHQRKPWTPTTGPDGRRGSWGGHAIHVGAYGKKGLTCTTWGARQRMTWPWWTAYVAEAYAVVSPDWINPATGLCPQGLNVDALMTDLQRITA